MCHLIVQLPVQDIGDFSGSPREFDGREAFPSGAEVTWPMGSLHVAYISYTPKLPMMFHHSFNQMFKLLSLVWLDLVDANLYEVSGFSAQGVVSS
jgi:hypothetical protein